MTDDLSKGEAEGHPFRGNQYTRGIPGADGVSGVVGAKESAQSPPIASNTPWLGDRSTAAGYNALFALQEKITTSLAEKSKQVGRKKWTGNKAIDAVRPKASEYDPAPLVKWNNAQEAASRMVLTPDVVKELVQFLDTHVVFYARDLEDDKPGDVRTPKKAKAKLSSLIAGMAV